jgi:hypothetical protein
MDPETMTEVQKKTDWSRLSQRVWRQRTGTKRQRPASAVQSRTGGTRQQRGCAEERSLGAMGHLRGPKRAVVLRVAAGVEQDEAVKRAIRGRRRIIELGGRAIRPMAGERKRSRLKFRGEVEAEVVEAATMPLS